MYISIQIYIILLKLLLLIIIICNYYEKYKTTICIFIKIIQFSGYQEDMLLSPRFWCIKTYFGGRYYY